MKALGRVEEDLPGGEHHGPARQRRAERHEDHAPRHDVEDPEEKIRREPQRNEGERQESQKGDELHAQEIKVGKRIPGGGRVVVHGTNGYLGRRVRHPVLSLADGVTRAYRCASLDAPVELTPVASDEWRVARKIWEGA